MLERLAVPEPDALDGAGARRVALEVLGVDLDAADRAAAPRRTIAQSCPGPRRRLVSQPSPMFARGPGMIRLCREPKNMSLQATTSAPFSSAREIDVAAAARSSLPVGDDLAVDAQARDAAVGEDVEPQVREPRVRRSIANRFCESPCERRLAAAISLHAACVSASDRRQRAGDRSRVDRARLGEVAAEEGGVDDDAADHARHAEPDDAPVVRVGPVAAPARLPAVHPLAAIGVLALAPDRRGGLEQVLLRGEELVVGRDDRAAEALRREIDQLGETVRS